MHFGYLPSTLSPMLRAHALLAELHHFLPVFFFLPLLPYLGLIFTIQFCSTVTKFFLLAYHIYLLRYDTKVLGEESGKAFSREPVLSQTCPKRERKCVM